MQRPHEEKRCKNPTMYETIKFVKGGRFYSNGEWRHPERIIDTVELIIVSEGLVSMFVEDRRYEARHGDIIRILPGERHGGVNTSTETSFFWIHFTGAAEGELPPELIAPRSFSRIELISKELLHYAKDPAYSPECADWALKLLLSEIARSEDETDGKLASEVKEWIRRNITSAIKTKDAARAFGYNEDYLNRIFRKSVGRSLKQHIDTARLDAIKRELLVGEESLTELSVRYGFSEYKYFLKFFKYHEGMSPSKFRQTYYNIHTNS